jgi:hypothetical protein
MSEVKTNPPVKVGLLLVALSWFTFTTYEFIINIFNGGNVPYIWVYATDFASGIGLGLRTVASLMAVITIAYYLFGKKTISKGAIGSFRRILVLESAYFFISFFPSAIWAIVDYKNVAGTLPIFMEWTLPCLVESILIPAVLIKLYFELGSNKPRKNVFRWAIISGVAYIFVFWLNNTGNWILAIAHRGNSYLMDYPLNILGFLVTAAGLLALGLYAANLARKSFSENFRPTTTVRKIGAILTALGLYYLGMYMIWIFFGSVGGWSDWNAWFLGHNADLWIMMLPMLGLPLMFYGQNTEKTT